MLKLYHLDRSEQMADIVYTVGGVCSDGTECRISDAALPVIQIVR